MLLLLLRCRSQAVRLGSLSHLLWGNGPLGPSQERALHRQGRVVVFQVKIVGRGILVAALCWDGSIYFAWGALLNESDVRTTPIE